MEKNIGGKIFLALALALALVASGCAQPQDSQQKTAAKIERFTSYEDMEKAFSESRQGIYRGLGDALINSIPAPLAATQQGIAKSAEGSPRGSADYSETNIQVEGVDEADIVKSDGRHIYNFSKNRLVITDAYPIENSEIVSRTELKEASPLEMFVAGNRLVIFGNENYKAGFSTIADPYYYGSGKTVIQVYDISDREKPEIEKEIRIEGRYQTSRLIGNNAYFVINSYPRYYPRPLDEKGVEGESGNNEERNNIIPLLEEDGAEKRIAKPEEIGYIPPMPIAGFVTIGSLDLDSKEFRKEVIAGSAESVFASQNNIYLSSTVWLPDPEPEPKEAGEGLAAQAEYIIEGNRGNMERTVVNKFSLENGEIGFVGQGTVPGHVLNQFSMDEFQGNLRIATTLGNVSRGGGQSSNNLYVLNAEMETIGKLEDLAPGERIYSARFMGERAYMVTFKKVDPLFVIDVSEPTNPRVLGKLKIPGYSDYLHPIDEGHIIGVGKETIEAAKGDFAWYQGLKMAVFDVSDVENPKEMHRIIIGDRGTESYALQDHKAFLYDREKELLVLPIMLAEIPEEKKRPLGEEQIAPSYGEPVFQGAFVYRLTLENGFEERGRITHTSAEEELKRGEYFGDDYSVKRALYISNVLYTLSGKMLKANSLDTLEELKEFEF